MARIPFEPVLAVAVTNVDFDGGAPDEVDGVALFGGARVLLAGQDDAKENGPYKVRTLGSGSDGTWTRARDANTNDKLRPNSSVWVKEGDDFADTQWVITSDSVQLGVTNIVWERVQGPAEAYADAGDVTTLAAAASDATTKADAAKVAAEVASASDAILLAIPSIIAWWRGDDVVQASGAISQWNDKSGNGNHLAQATAGQRATYVAADGTIGRPCGDFDGTDDKYLLNGLGVDGGAAGDYTEYTVFAVFKFDGTGNYGLLECTDVSQAGFSGLDLFHDGSGMQFAAPSGAKECAAAYTATTWAWVLGIHYGGSRRLYVNGALVDTDTGADNPNALVLAIMGALWNGGTPQYFLDGRIADMMLIGSALTPNQRKAFAHYVNTLYGL